MKIKFQLKLPRDMQSSCQGSLIHGLLKITRPEIQQGKVTKIYRNLFQATITNIRMSAMTTMD